MKQVHLHLTGEDPGLLMHRPVTVNPLAEETKAIKEYTGKRKKTEDDHRMIMRLEWQAGLYHDAELGPYVPGINLATCLRDAGKITKMGSAITRGVVVAEDKLRIDYKGPRGTNGSGLQDLWDANLKDYRVVGNQQNSVMRCRPFFPGWSLDANLYVEESIVDATEVVAIAERAGVMIGLGDYRPRFGRFSVKAS